MNSDMTQEEFEKTLKSDPDIAMEYYNNQSWAKKKEIYPEETQRRWNEMSLIERVITDKATAYSEFRDMTWDQLKLLGDEVRDEYFYQLSAEDRRLLYTNEYESRCEASKNDFEKRMALGQYIAGMGFSNVGLGIDHAMAHTLSAHYDTPHGVACAMFLPISMEFNREYTGERLREVARAMGVEGVDNMSQDEYRDAAIAAVKKLSEDVGIPKTLDKITEEDLDVLATDALNDACYPGNPREATKEQVIEMFRMLMA